MYELWITVFVKPREDGEGKFDKAHFINVPTLPDVYRIINDYAMSSLCELSEVSFKKIK